VRTQNSQPFRQIEADRDEIEENLVEIGVGQDGELLLDGLEHPHRDVQPGVGGVRQLRRVLHRPEGATGLGRHIERPSGVPPAR
jgi:hypothetical protein